MGEREGGDGGIQRGTEGGRGGRCEKKVNPSFKPARPYRGDEGEWRKGGEIHHIKISEGRRSRMVEGGHPFLHPLHPDQENREGGGWREVIVSSCTYRSRWDGNGRER